MKKFILKLTILGLLPLSAYALDKPNVLYEAFSTGQKYGVKFKDDKKNLKYNRQQGFDFCKKKYFPNQNVAYYCAIGVGSGIFNINMSFQEFKKTLK